MNVYNNIDPSVEGMVAVMMPDNMTARTLLNIVHYVGDVHGNPNIIVAYGMIYFKYEDEAIMFRLKYGA